MSLNSNFKSKGSLSAQQKPTAETSNFNLPSSLAENNNCPKGNWCFDDPKKEIDFPQRFSDNESSDELKVKNSISTTPQTPLIKKLNLKRPRQSSNSSFVFPGGICPKGPTVHSPGFFMSPVKKNSSNKSSFWAADCSTVPSFIDSSNHTTKPVQGKLDKKQQSYLNCFCGIKKVSKKKQLKYQDSNLTLSEIGSFQAQRPYPSLQPQRLRCKSASIKIRLPNDPVPVSKPLSRPGSKISLKPRSLSEIRLRKFSRAQTQQFPSSKREEELFSEGKMEVKQESDSRSINFIDRKKQLSIKKMTESSQNKQSCEFKIPKLKLDFLPKEGSSTKQRKNSTLSSSVQFLDFSGENQTGAFGYLKKETSQVSEESLRTLKNQDISQGYSFQPKGSIDVFEEMNSLRSLALLDPLDVGRIEDTRYFEQLSAKSKQEDDKTDTHHTLNKGSSLEVVPKKGLGFEDMSKIVIERHFSHLF